jgi:hypothetical protein
MILCEELVICFLCFTKAAKPALLALGEQVVPEEGVWCLFLHTKRNATAIARVLVAGIIVKRGDLAIFQRAGCLGW